jgi:hypothetical protein
MIVQDGDNLINCILVAATDIRGKLDNWFMSGTPFDFTMKHACELKEVTLSSSFKEMPTLWTCIC